MNKQEFKDIQQPFPSDGLERFTFFMVGFVFGLMFMNIVNYLAS